MTSVIKQHQRLTIDMSEEKFEDTKGGNQE
jgi:hypothetical protein